MDEKILQCAPYATFLRVHYQIALHLIICCCGCHRSVCFNIARLDYVSLQIRYDYVSCYYRSDGWLKHFMTSNCFVSYAVRCLIIIYCPKLFPVYVWTGVFLEASQHLLIVCFPTELVMVLKMILHLKEQWTLHRLGIVFLFLGH